jgi:Phage Mu protein F like protein
MPIGIDSGGGSAQATDAGTTDGGYTWPDIEAIPLVPIVWTRWQTMEDERVCPECGPLDGFVWEDGDGPYPPLHVNCRCTRLYAFTEWQTRTED